MVDACVRAVMDESSKLSLCLFVFFFFCYLHDQLLTNQTLCNAVLVYLIAIIEHFVYSLRFYSADINDSQ